jgi:hypothetical protein
MVLDIPWIDNKYSFYNYAQVIMLSSHVFILHLVRLLECFG